jgi:hypothetical protein
MTSATERSHQVEELKTSDNRVRCFDALNSSIISFWNNLFIIFFSWPILLSQATRSRGMLTLSKFFKALQNNLIGKKVNFWRCLKTYCESVSVYKEWISFFKGRDLVFAITWRRFFTSFRLIICHIEIYFCLNEKGLLNNLPVLARKVSVTICPAESETDKNIFPSDTRNMPDTCLFID